MNKIKQSIIENYKDKVNLYEDFAKSTAYILEASLKDNNFFFLTISPRVKTVDSLEDKLNRLNLKKLNIKKFSDIQDLAGVRIIFYLESDARRFIAHIYDEFGEKNIIKHEFKIDEDGYNAIHLVVKLDENRIRLSEYSRFKDLKCEIQLTTVLYHAWSEMAHNLIYKSKRELLDFDKRSFEVLNKHFKEVMNYIKEASISFEAIYYKFKEIQKGKEVFDIKFLKSISKYDSNNEIYRHLELLEKYTAKFGDKVPKDMNIIQLIAEAIKKSKSNKIENEKTVFGELPGKTYSDIVIKCLEILSHVRYTGLIDVFNLLINLHQEPDEKIKNKVKEVLGRLVRYDLNVLKKIGYSVQRKILDTVLNWSERKKMENTEVLKIIAKELLQSSFEGASMKDYKTMVFHSGTLHPTDYLKKTRRDTINLIIGLYKQVKDIKKKLSLLETLSHASYFPIHGDYGDELTKMITDDVKYLVKNYKEIIFNKKGKIIAEAPIVQEVEKQLNWISQRFKIPKISSLLNQIRKDEFYSLYRLLVGDLVATLKRGESWEKAKESKEREIENTFKTIDKKNIKKWIDNLNSIAKHKDVVDGWKFNEFRGFLFRIAKEKPHSAKIILDDALDNDKPLKSFVGQFLFGFRYSNNTKIWDRYVIRIIKYKDVKLLNIIPSSFSVDIGLKNIRKKDIDLLSQMIKKEKPFDFLKKVKKNELLNLNFSSIRTLLHIYRKNKKQTEELIKILIESDQDKQYLHMYLEQLGFPAYRNEIDLSEWSKKNIKFILDKLVELKNLKYETQLLLLAIAKNDFPSAINIFIERIKKRDELTKREKKWISSSEYDAIPYHFNNDFKEYIGSHEQYPKIVGGWVKKMTLKSSTYNIELAQFLQRIDGAAFKDILLQVIKKGGDNNLNKAVSLLWGIDSPDFNICFEIIKKTDNRKIINRVGGMMFNTGMVSGEYGIPIAHERKVKEIKKYKAKGTKKEKERVEKFKKEIIQSLEKTAKRERQRTEENIKLRKLEFEG